MAIITLPLVSSSYLGKIIGLIGKKTPQAIFFKTRFGIHTFGVRFPIDVVILDNNKIVVATKKYLQPNKVFLWNPRYNSVLELPEGTIKKQNIQLHDKIIFSEVYPL
jgi:hypothetical protein